MYIVNTTILHTYLNVLSHRLILANVDALKKMCQKMWHQRSNPQPWGILTTHSTTELHPQPKTRSHHGALASLELIDQAGLEFIEIYLLQSP